MEWAAGLFEGEGAVHREGRRPKLSLKMTQEESVRRFHTDVGVGVVYGPYGPYEKQPNRSPFWMWVAEGATAIAVAKELLPHASPWLATRLADVCGPPS